MALIRHAEWSTSGLIQSIARNALLPANQQTFQTADFIAMLNEACQSTVVPFILGLDGNYFLKTVQIPIVQSQSVAFVQAGAGTNGANVAYQLPADAVGKKLMNVSVVNSQGTMVTLPQITPWQAGSLTAYAQGCWIQGDVLFLYPAQQFSAQTAVQIVYPAAPLALCDDTGLAADGLPSSAQISAINTATGAITLVSVTPSAFTVGTAVNFVAGTPQFATTTASTITAVAGLVITVDPTVLLDSYNRPTVNVGDWVANLGYSPFLQLPVEARNLVTQATIVKLLEAMKDDGSAEASKRYDAMERSALKLFAPRIDDSPKVISSYGRGIGSWRRWGGWFR